MLCLLLTAWMTLFIHKLQAQPCEELFTKSTRLYEHYRSLPVLAPSQIHEATQLLDSAMACPTNRAPHRQAYLTYIKADLLLSARYYDTAHQTLDAFLETQATHTDSLYLSRLYWLRGYLNFLTGSLEQMIQDYARALLYLPRKPAFYQDRLDLLLSIASTYQHVYQYRESERVILEARQFLENTQELNSPLNHAFLTEYMADLYVHAPSHQLRYLPQDPSWYLGQLEQARGIFRQYDSSELPVILILEAQLHERAGRDSLALILYRHAYTSAIKHARTRQAIEALLKEAAIAHRLGQPPATVERLLIQAADLAQQVPLELPNVHTTLGAWYEHQHLLEKAENHYRKAIQYLEERVLHLSVSEWAMEVFASQQEAYRGLVRLYLRKGRLEDALTALEHTHARQLRLLLQQLRVQHGLTDAERALLEQIRQRIHAIQAQLLQDTLDVTTKATLQTELIQLYEQQRRLLAVNMPPPPDLTTIQNHLRDHRQIALVYFIDRPHSSFPSSAISYVFVVSGNSLTGTPLSIDEDSLSSEIRLLFPPQAMPTELSDTQFDTEALYRLYRILVAPVEPHIKSYAYITVVPDGSLVQLPFSMLMRTPTSPYTYPIEAFLLSYHTFSYALSLTLLKETSSPAPSYIWDLLALGRTHFTDLPDTSLHRLPPLPGVREEVHMLGKLLTRSFIALDEQATEYTLLREGPQSRIAHLASHTLVNPYQPLQTYMVLSPDSQQVTTDGKLHLYELQQRTFPVSLAVLSSCNTAGGTLLGGEGLLGLQYAFLASGARSTLASLWSVSDDVWFFLMRRFYTYLKKGERKDEAWRQARLDFIQTHSDALQSPFFWSPGILYGSPLPLFRGTHVPRYLYLFLILLLLGGFFWIRTRYWKLSDG